MGEKKTLNYQEIKNYIEVESDNGCKLITTEEEFKKEKIKQNKNNSMVKLKVLCGQCKKEIFKTNFSKFKSGNKRQCNKCGVQNRKDKQKKNIVSIQNEFIKKGYVPLFTQEDYKNAHAKLLIQTKEGYKTLLAYDKLKQNRTPRLFYQNNPYTIENIKLWLKINEPTYSLLSENFVSSKDNKLLWKCDKGHEFELTWDKMLQGGRCPVCYGNFKKTTDQFKKDIYNLLGGEYKILSEYKGANKKIKVQHSICQNIYYVTPANLLYNNRRCPYCNESKAERLIEDYLRNNQIEYDREFTFNDLIGVGGGLLRYDFAIFKDEEKAQLKCLIEYDGEFHYKKYYDEQNFEKQQKHDKLKNKYCIENNIKLIRIPYWEKENMEDILDKELKYSKYTKNQAS